MLTLAPLETRERENGGQIRKKSRALRESSDKAPLRLAPTTITNIKEIALKTVSTSKIEIKRVLQSLHGFDVDKVRTLNMESRKRKRGGLLINKPDYKKAYVTLGTPLSVSPHIFPLKALADEKERMNKQKKSSFVEEDGGDGKRRLWLDEVKEERAGKPSCRARRSGHVAAEKTKFPWSSMRTCR